MTAKKAKAPRSLEEILKLSAKERARIVVDYRERRYYSLKQDITAEEKVAIEESLYRSTPGERALRKARALQQETREITYLALAACERTIRHIEILKRAELRENMNIFIWSLYDRINNTLKRIHGDIYPYTEEVDDRIELSKDRATKAIAKSFLSIKTSLELSKADPKEITNNKEHNIQELREALTEYQVLKLTALGLMKAHRMKITGFTFHLEEMDKAIRTSLRAIETDVKAEPDPEEVASTIKNHLQIIEEQSYE
ncbi:MAG: hypothetical protein ACK5XN_04650 [Bacteroidota bacterium]|jgi:hypothetical protein